MNAYRDAVVEIVVRERDDALHRLQQVRDLCNTAKTGYGDATVQAIRNALNRPTTTNHRQEHQP